MADETITKAEHDAAIAKLSDEIEKLTNKYSGAMDDLKKAQREARAAKEVNPADLEAALDRAEKAEARTKELEKASGDATKAREKAEKALADEQGFTSKLLIQDGLKSALIANGVKDEDFITSLSALFAGGASITVEGDQRKAMYGDKALADHIKEWAGSDAGKKFVSAPNNAGGGAGGGSGQGAQGKTMSRDAFNGLDAKGQMEFSKGGGQLTD